MNNNNYYHVTFVSGIAETGAYIVDSPASKLPNSLGPVSSFNNIEDHSLLTGLAWAGKPNEGYWRQETASDEPHIEHHQYLSEIHTFVFESGCINVSYDVGSLSNEDVVAKTSAWKDQIRFTRNEYLSLTDFTQLSDSPISSEIKEEYRVFREGLRTMFDDIEPTGTGLAWPAMPTGAANINLQPLPPFPPLT